MGQGIGGGIGRGGNVQGLQGASAASGRASEASRKDIFSLEKLHRKLLGEPGRFLAILQVSKERSPSDPNRFCIENPGEAPQKSKENG